MEHEHASAREHGEASADADVAAFKWARLRELGRLREIGVRGAERISLCFQGKLSAEEAAAVAGKDGLPMEFCRTARAVRQVIVLEMELVGLRAAPDREADHEALKGLNRAGEKDGRERESDPGDHENLRDVGDYMNGPMEDVVARIRKDLHAEPPPNDPFTPRPRKPAEPKNGPAAEPDLKPEAPKAASAAPKPEPKPAARAAPNGAQGGFAGTQGNRAAKREQGRRARAARRANRAKGRGHGGASGRGHDPPG